MSTVSDFGLDPDLAVQEQLLAQKKQIADALTARGATPIHVQSGTISPLQGAGQMLNAYLGKKRRDEVTADTSRLGEDYNRRLSEGVNEYMRAKQGTPAVPSQQFEDSAGNTQFSPDYPATPGDPREAMTRALLSRNPFVRNLGTMDYQAELKRSAPFSVAADAKHIIPAANGQPTIEYTNPKQPEHAIPGNWSTSLPEGASRQPNDPAGVFRLPGTDGQQDVYQMEFDRGALKGYKKLDSSQVTRVTNNNPAPITVTTIADPTDPTRQRTLQVDGRTYKGGGIGSPGVIGEGQKLTQTGGVDTKLALSKPQAELRVQSISQNMDRLASAMQALHDDKGLPQITGTVYGRTPNLTNKATGAQAQLNSIKSQIFQESLQAMREASKTGGAVGNVSDREGDKLERTLAALDQAQGTPAFQAQLKKAMAQVKLSKQLIQKAFEDQYSHVQPYVPGGGGGAPAAGSTLKFDAQGNPIP